MEIKQMEEFITDCRVSRKWMDEITLGVKLNYLMQSSLLAKLSTVLVLMLIFDVGF